MKARRWLLNGAHMRVRSVKMMGSLIFVLLMGAALMMAGQVFAQPVTDDFNDNKKNKVLWGPDHGYGQGVLTETNHRLEYTTPGGDAEPIRDFIASQGLYTADWEVQMDVFNGTKPSGRKRSSVGLYVYKCSNPDVYYVYAELYAAPEWKSFYGDFEYSGGGWSVETDDLSGDLPLSGKTKISFDSINKIIALSYDIGSGWVQFGSFGVSSAGGGADDNGDWLMTDTDQFCFSIYGWSEEMAIPSGKIYLDNFQATEVTEPLSTHVVQPDGTTPVPAGDPSYPVSWEAPLLATQFKLQYSLDNGTTWQNMTQGRVTGQSYNWEVPAKGKRRCLVKITAYNDRGAKIATAVSAPFAIEVVKLDAPNGGEPLISEAPFPITWTTSPYVAADHIQLYYTLDNGATWKTINTSGDSSDDGSFDWMVARVGKKKNCKVKIVLKSASDKTLGSDVSDAPFTIEPAVP